MPPRLTKHLPTATPGQIALLFGSTIAVKAYPADDPIRLGVITGKPPTHSFNCGLMMDSTAYNDVMKIMTVVAIVFAIIPIILALFMPNWHLGDFQNAVDQKDLAGHTTVPTNGHNRAISEGTDDTPHNSTVLSAFNSDERKVCEEHLGLVGCCCLS